MVTDDIRVRTEYVLIPPTGLDAWARFDYPDSIEWDLIDYEVKPNQAPTWCGLDSRSARFEQAGISCGGW